jgi:peroxiredoxin Q/BCP
MRDGYVEFTKRDAEILAVGPNDAQAFKQFWENEGIPYVGLADPNHNVARTYRQEVNLLKLGRMPLVCVVGEDGRIRYAHYGLSMSDIPDNETLLHVIDEINAASN